MKQISQQQIKTEVDYGEFIQRNLQGKKLVHKGLQFNERPDRGNKQAYPCRDFGAKTIGIHFAEVPPNSPAGTHRHLCEAIIHILEGRGYSVINGERYDWEAGDTIFIPPLSWHKHVNTDDKPMRFVAAWSVPLFEGLGLYMNEELGDEDSTGAGAVVTDRGSTSILASGGPLFPGAPSTR